MGTHVRAPKRRLTKVSYRNKEKQPPCNYSVSHQALNIFISEGKKWARMKSRKRGGKRWEKRWLEEGKKKKNLSYLVGFFDFVSLRWWRTRQIQLSCCCQYGYNTICCLPKTTNQATDATASWTLEVDICRKEAQPFWSRTLSAPEKITSLRQRKRWASERQTGPDAGWVIETAYCCSVSFTET